MNKLKTYISPAIYIRIYANDVVRTSNPQEKDCIADPYTAVFGN